MSHFRNLTVDIPSRIQKLDVRFQPIAQELEYDVTYLLMKLASAFLLPYERIDGDSGAKQLDINNLKFLRRSLGLRQSFTNSCFCTDPNQWAFFQVDEFPFDASGKVEVLSEQNPATETVLRTLRNAIAHSNLLFAGTKGIEFVFLVSEARGTPDYNVVRCSVKALAGFAEAWIMSLATTPASHGVVWNLIETCTAEENGEDRDGPSEEV